MFLLLGLRATSIAVVGLVIASMTIWLSSAVSNLVQSVLRALCIILSSCWSNNVGQSTSISFDVWEQELDLMVEHIQFFIGGSLPSFHLSHLSMAPPQSCPG